MTALTPTQRAIPAIGNWLLPREGSPKERSGPGMVVAVLPSGGQVILAARVPPSYAVVETVHRTADLIGPMTGKRVMP
jgi:hypothetical protein